MTETAVSDEARNRLIDLATGYRAAKVLLVAAHYDLFTLIENGRTTVRELAKSARLNLRAADILVSALVALGLLRRKGEALENVPGYRDLLVQGAPGDMGNNLKYQEMIWSAWSDLGEVMKRGRPRRILGDWLFKDEFGAEYIRGMANIARRPAEEIAALFPAGRASALLDVGAGPGSYALAFLRRHPDLTADLLDLPSTIRISGSILKNDPLRERVRFRAGDYHETDFGRGLYDFVIMSHITHDEGPSENAKLVKKAFAALKPGGHLIIHDFMKDAQAAEIFTAIFSVHMLVYTEKGRVYSEEEYSTWMTSAGFEEIRRHSICKDTANATVALIGSRPSR